MPLRPFLLLASVLAILRAPSAADEIDQRIVGDAILNPEGYRLLDTLTTRYGGRMAGTPGNAASLDHLEQRLKALGIATRRERFDIPGWRRGEDRLEFVSPRSGPLRVAALGYVDAHGPVEASLVRIRSTDPDVLIDAMGTDATTGKIGLAAPHLRFGQEELRRFAEESGLLGILLINRVDGGQLLARTANFSGEPAPLPVVSITAEDGGVLGRLLDAGANPVVRLQTTSECVELSVENLIATLPGRSDSIVLVGGHVDSWDLGDGAIDNGLGVAQLFDVARLLHTHNRRQEHTVEVAFFNAEEWGLWGSRDYVERHDLSRLRVMINLDMVGRPIALNAMGFDELLPVLEGFVGDLGAWNLEPKVANKTWLGSDHHPFIVEGIPAITLNAPIDREQGRYYHDGADTFDKIDAEMLGRATAITALLVRALANDTTSDLRRYESGEVVEMFRAVGLEDRMRRMGLWSFGD
jgi:Iap family predicted aminopeptidase